MKKIFLMGFMLCTQVSAGSPALAILDKMEIGPAYGYWTCYYHLAYSNYRFSLISSSICKTPIQIDLSTGFYE